MAVLRNHLAEDVVDCGAKKAWRCARQLVKPKKVARGPCIQMMRMEIWRGNRVLLYGQW